MNTLIDIGRLDQVVEKIHEKLNEISSRSSGTMYGTTKTETGDIIATVDGISAYAAGISFYLKFSRNYKFDINSSPYININNLGRKRIIFNFGTKGSTISGGTIVQFYMTSASSVTLMGIIPNDEYFPIKNGPFSPGSIENYARIDHIHPRDDRLPKLVFSNSPGYTYYFNSSASGMGYYCIAVQDISNKGGVLQSNDGYSWNYYALDNGVIPKSVAFNMINGRPVFVVGTNNGYYIYTPDVDNGQYGWAYKNVTKQAKDHYVVPIDSADYRFSIVSAGNTYLIKSDENEEVYENGISYATKMFVSPGKIIMLPRKTYTNVVMSEDYGITWMPYGDLPSTDKEYLGCCSIQTEDGERLYITDRTKVFTLQDGIWVDMNLDLKNMPINAIIPKTYGSRQHLLVCTTFGTQNLRFFRMNPDGNIINTYNIPINTAGFIAIDGDDMIVVYSSAISHVKYDYEYDIYRANTILSPGFYDSGYRDHTSEIKTLLGIQ